MKRDELLKVIRKAKGPIMAEVRFAGFVGNVQVVKTDLIWKIEYEIDDPDQETGLTLTHRSGYNYLETDQWS
jgi:hypothetical protein